MVIAIHSPLLNSTLKWMLGIFFAALLTFSPALSNEYCLDDFQQADDLELPRGPGGWFHAAAAPWWPSNPHSSLWRPVARLSILIQKAVTGQRAWPLYAFNILLHGAVSVLLFMLGRQLGLGTKAAGLAGMFFAVHPIHSEAVHQIVGRTEMLVACWSIAGLLLLGRLGLRDWRGWVAQPLIFALALGSKENGVIYPVFVLLAIMAGTCAAIAPRDVPRRETMRKKGARKRAAEAPAPAPQAPWRRFMVPLREWQPWAMMAVLGAVLALYLTGKLAVTGLIFEDSRWVPVTENPLAQMRFLERLPAVLGIFGYAASRLAWPAGLSPDYSAVCFPFIRGWGWGWSWAGLALLAGVLAWAVLDLRRGGRGWAMAAAALASYGLISNGLLTFGEATAQRFWYLPSAPACLGAGWLMAGFYGRLKHAGRIWGGVALALALAALSCATWGYAWDWRSDVNFARATLARFPLNIRGHIKLAYNCLGTRDYQSGYEHARRAVEIYPDHVSGWMWRGANAMFLPEHQAEAEADFQQALKLGPQFVMTHRYYADLLLQKGRRREAARHLEEYLESPNVEERALVEQQLAELKKMQ